EYRVQKTLLIRLHQQTPGPDLQRRYQADLLSGLAQQLSLRVRFVPAVDPGRKRLRPLRAARPITRSAGTSCNTPYGVGLVAGETVAVGDGGGGAEFIFVSSVLKTAAIVLLTASTCCLTCASETLFRPAGT